MQTVSLSKSSVTLKLTIAELAMINDALSYRGQIAATPRYNSDRLNESDAQLCNEMEQETFRIFCAQTYSIIE